MTPIERDTGDVEPDGVHRVLEFATEYIDPICRGEKTATVRVGADAALEPGHNVDAVTPEGHTFARLHIDAVATGHADTILDRLAIFGANYPHDETSDLLRALQRHYDDDLGPETPVRGIVFDVIDDDDQDDDQDGQPVIAADPDGLESLEGRREFHIECATSVADDVDLCDWSTTVTLEAPARLEDERLVLPGFRWECPQCGQPWEFFIDGVGVSRLV